MLHCACSSPWYVGFKVVSPTELKTLHIHYQIGTPVAQHHGSCICVSGIDVGNGGHVADPKVVYSPDTHPGIEYGHGIAVSPMRAVPAG